MSDAAMNELLEIRRVQREKERAALDSEVAQSQQTLRNRISMAANDPTLNIEVEDENKD